MDKPAKTPPPLPGRENKRHRSNTLPIIIAAIVLIAGAAVATFFLLRPSDRDEPEDDESESADLHSDGNTAAMPAEKEVAIVPEETTEKPADSIAEAAGHSLEAVNSTSATVEPEGALSYDGYITVSGDRYPIALSFNKNGSSISSAKYRNISQNVGFNMNQKQERSSGWYRLEGFDSNATFTLRFHFNSDGTATGTATLGPRSADLYLAPRH